MIKKITLNSSKERIEKFWNQRGSRIQFWKCLNCKNNYNSENAIIKERDGHIYLKKLGFRVSVFCCPYCKIEQINHNAKWLKSEMKYYNSIGYGKKKKGFYLKTSEELKELRKTKDAKGDN